MKAFFKPRVLVTGGAGFIGSNFVRHTTALTHMRVIAPTHHDLDVLSLPATQSVFREFKPDIVINFAAHRNANTAELERENTEGSAWKTNVLGVRNIVQASRESGSFLIHISTDMVFSGSKRHPGPYKETDEPEVDSGRVSWYGWTKAEGERTITDRIHSAVIRIGNVTQPVYDPTLDYVGKILYLYDTGSLYPLFTDQQLTLTSIPQLFELMDFLMRTKAGGVYHVASRNTFAPHELGEYLIRTKRKKKPALPAKSIDIYLKEAPHRYPKYGGLLAHETSKKTGLSLLTWQEIIDNATF